MQSNWLHTEAWRLAFAEIDIGLEKEDERRQIGKGGYKLIRFMCRGGRKQVEEPLKAYRKHIFQAEFLPQVKALPQAREFLARVKAAGIRVALASSADKDELQIYKIVGMEELVDEETSADDADRSKPYPDIFQAALERLKLATKKCMELGIRRMTRRRLGRGGCKRLA